MEAQFRKETIRAILLVIPVVFCLGLGFALNIKSNQGSIEASVWLLALTAFFGCMVPGQIHSRRRLWKWATASGLEIIRYEERPVRRGLFLWNSWNWHLVFFVVVRDVNGLEKSAFVRFCVGLFSLSSRADVIWK
jgi:hypothetical protein